MKETYAYLRGKIFLRFFVNLRGFVLQLWSECVAEDTYYHLHFHKDC